ncbi:WD40 repeat domain-containing serine/threonine protein kinase [Nocardia aurantiaca]|uniref:Protein kinase n=1 Tax=Nocardia aurantiaca TaxID=2675850 RepID=A0A6I3KXI0_9NOCA|nr:serine/threonine-protein kinase [Nocardia aurantiaca]MTE12794.1 protein kinase [Nocardia aurantiaca]
MVVISEMDGSRGLEFQRGRVFAGYTIERLLGTGGMGRVYLAQHPRLERLVALKVLGNGGPVDAKARAAFDREAALAARLDHPNIVAVYDRSGPNDSMSWLSMRYIDGGDVTALLASEPEGLAAERAVRLISDAAHALDFAHQRGVLHRDVKPANLLVEHDPRGGERALLSDFGIARTLDDTVTLSGMAASFAYVAPERLTDRPVDHRADIYSLGCTLFQLLTGQPPFPRADQAAVITAHLTEPPPAPSARRPGLPVALDTVIATAMAKDPEDRYPSCVAFAEDAARAVKSTAPMALVVDHRHHDGEHETSSPTVILPPDAAARITPTVEVRAAAETPPYGRHQISRRRLLIAGVVGIPATAAGVTGALIASRSDTRKSPSLIATLTGPTDAVVSVAFSPDGSLLAAGSWDKTVWLWNVHTHQPAGPPLTGHTSDINSVAFNPVVGTMLVTGSGDRTARLWNVHTGKPDGSPLTGHTDGVTSVAFSPDGSLITTGSGDKTVRIWNTRTGQPDGRPLSYEGRVIMSVAFSPDGTELATALADVAPYDRNNSVPVWNVQSRIYDSPLFIDNTETVSSVVFSPDGTLLATGSTDKTVRVWKQRSRAQDGSPLTGHTDTVNSIAFSPDGTLLASGSHDKTVRLWNLLTREPAGTPLTGHTDEVWSVAFSPDGTLLATGSRDKTVRLWKL